MNLEKAMLDPSSEFATPAAVCDAPGLTHEQKIEILRRWEYDARELQVAAEENMGNGVAGLMEAILAALRQLGVEGGSEQSSPTKQGGQ